MGGWLVGRGAGSIYNRANSAFNLIEVEVEAEAELGKIVHFLSQFHKALVVHCFNSSNYLSRIDFISVTHKKAN